MWCVCSLKARTDGWCTLNYSTKDNGYIFMLHVSSILGGFGCKFWGAFEEQMCTKVMSAFSTDQSEVDTKNHLLHY